MAKKERGRFSLRFNIGDPVQRAAVELLELQPPHSKSQYIANALVYYNANFADDPQPVKASPPALDRAAIEAIVKEILRQETKRAEQPITSSVSPQKDRIDSPISEQSKEPDDKLIQGETTEVDHAIRSMIFDTMAAFRREK